MVGAEDGLIVVKEAIDFRDLGAGGGSGMFRLRGAVDGSDDGGAPGAEEIGGGTESEGEVAMYAIAGIGRDGGDVAVELSPS